MGLRLGDLGGLTLASGTSIITLLTAVLGSSLTKWALGLSSCSVSHL